MPTATNYLSFLGAEAFKVKFKEVQHSTPLLTFPEANELKEGGKTLKFHSKVRITYHGRKKLQTTAQYGSHRGLK